MGPGSRVAGPLPTGTVLRAADVSSLDDRLLDHRIVALGQEIDEQVAHLICGRLLLLAAENSRNDITLYVSSSGGSPGAATAIHDTMRWVGPEVVTVVYGTVAGAGLLVAAAGAPGRRSALPHARYQLAPPAGGIGMTGDVRAGSEELGRQRRAVVELVAQHCGRTVEDVAAGTEQGRWFTADQARGYGLVDRIAEVTG